MICNYLHFERKFRKYRLNSLIIKIKICLKNDDIITQLSENNEYKYDTYLMVSLMSLVIFLRDDNVQDEFFLAVFSVVSLHHWIKTCIVLLTDFFFVLQKLFKFWNHYDM